MQLPYGACAKERSRFKVVGGADMPRMRAWLCAPPNNWLSTFRVSNRHHYADDASIGFYDSVVMTLESDQMQELNYRFINWLSTIRVQNWQHYPDDSCIGFYVPVLMMLEFDQMHELNDRWNMLEIQKFPINVCEPLNSSRIKCTRSIIVDTCLTYLTSKSMSCEPSNSTTSGEL